MNWDRLLDELEPSIRTVRAGLARGVRFRDIRGRELATLEDVMNAIMEDGGVEAIEPPIDDGMIWK